MYCYINKSTYYYDNNLERLSHKVYNKYISGNKSLSHLVPPYCKEVLNTKLPAMLGFSSRFHTLDLKRLHTEGDVCLQLRLRLTVEEGHKLHCERRRFVLLSTPLGRAQLLPGGGRQKKKNKKFCGAWTVTSVTSHPGSHHGLLTRPGGGQQVD